MFKFLRHIFCILTITVLISNIISLMSLLALGYGSFYKPSYLANKDLSFSLDYIVLGSSTGLTTLNTVEIDSILKTRSLNLSMDDTGMSTHLLMLKHFFNNGGKTDLCILAPTVSSYNNFNNKLSSNDYRFLPYINEPYVNEYFRGFKQYEAKLLANSDWQPVLGVGYYNSELFYPSILSLFESERRNRFDVSGNYTYPIKKNTSSPITHRETISITFNNAILEKIANLCKDNQVKLVCYITPLRDKVATFDRQEYDIINHSAILDNTSYFYDGIHVNSKGRDKTSKMFATEIKKYF